MEITMRPWKFGSYEETRHFLGGTRHGLMPGRVAKSGELKAAHIMNCNWASKSRRDSFGAYSERERVGGWRSIYEDWHCQFGKLERPWWNIGAQQRAITIF
ncbi:hypothetical protein VC83_03496 [Pseudogymnoascus destructans]|uniref:Uncharacterized protein n=1 Tax=Pseudogymnoascus destructans TaxID=655981 RepID=A0A177AEK5_9PEZI|nr:uncharacterized protein VC83_03496 [Pseudogymnoascus destructans]OAF60549.1 hypothetical protein VC83_03496 [Pseudogymnoascus destructans]